MNLAEILYKVYNESLYLIIEYSHFENMLDFSKVKCIFEPKTQYILKRFLTLLLHRNLIETYGESYHFQTGSNFVKKI